jgi:hypothetical protein
MDLTADVIRAKDLWTAEDSQLSGSAGMKSKGLANIDWRFTDLGKRNALTKVHRGVWKLNS